MLDFVADKSFDLEKTYEYILSIQVRLDGFSFLVSCPKENKLLATKDTPFKIISTSLISRRLNDWIKSEPLFSKPFKKYRIVVFSKQFTLIPQDLYNNGVKESVSNLLFENDSEMKLAENVLKNQKSRLIFSLPGKLLEVIQEQLGESQIVHPIKIALENLPVIEGQHQMMILFNSTGFYLAVLKGDQILVLNSFKAAHANDLVYYTLSVLQQLKVDSKKVNLIYAGKNELANNVVDLMKVYFSDIRLLERTNPLQVDPGLHFEDKHPFFTLYS